VITGDIYREPRMPSCGVGWQPSRFLAARAEAECAFQLAEQVSSVNAAAADLGDHLGVATNAFTRHGPRMPARIPVPSASAHRRGLPAQRPVAIPMLDAVFVALNHGPPGPRMVTDRAVPVDPPGRGVRHRLVEFNSESQAANPQRSPGDHHGMTFVILSS
jgi:hypothetical protein